MGPPPSKNPTTFTEPQIQTLSLDEPSNSAKPISSMGPPPPKNPATSTDSPSQTLTLDEPSTSANPKVPMGPPPPKSQSTVQPNSSPTPFFEASTEVSEPSTEASEPSTEASESSAMQPGNNSTHHQKTQSAAVPYTIPSWSEPPGHSFYLEVLKDGSIIDQLDV